ncbi:MAG: FecR domain-containing protein [Niabella sp.]
MLNERDLIEILKRIEQNIATEEDIRIYNSWCNSFQGKEGQKFSGAFEAKKAELLEKINRKIDNKARRLYRLMSVAAAVLVLVLLSTFFYRYTNRPGTWDRSAIASEMINDVAPGTNMATLLLADGQKIELSLLHKDWITTKSGVEIIQSADSMVAFKETAAAKSQTGRPLPYNSLMTGKAQKFQVLLPDGSKVWLNAATTIKFPATFAGLSQRRVELEGEAYFEVAKDPSKPFIVVTKQQEIKVLGTHFNVKCYAGKKGTVTTLLEGSVKVNNKHTLKPGEQAESDLKGAVYISKVNAVAEAAWQKGYFEFNDEDVYEVMNELARWYNVEIIYEGEIPPEKMQGTISRFQNISGVLAVLEATGVFKFKVENNKVYVQKASL